MDKDYDASTVWQVLQQWLNTDVEGQILLKLLKEDLQLGLQQLGDWLTTRTSQTPVQLATYVSGGQIEKLINIVSSTVIFQLSGSAFVVPSLHQLPSPPADFIGRQAEFDELLSKVHQSGIAILCLRGMGGIGKTSFALVLAKTLKSFCPDAQILLDLKGAKKQKALTPFQAMELIIRAFYPESNLPNNIDKLTNVYRSLFYNAATKELS